MTKRLLLVAIWACPFILGKPTSSASETLQEADNFASLYNFVAAAPLYASAERRFRAVHDERNLLYSHIGYLRSTMESRSLPELSHYLGTISSSLEARNDPRFSMECFAAKADVDAEIDSAPARADWEQVRRLAAELHDQRLQARATGEIGFARFVQGDHAGAQTDTTTALLYAHKTGDFAAQIRFLSGIGTGVVLGGNSQEAIHRYLDPALTLAAKHSDTGYPYMAVAGKIMGLLAEKDFVQAQPLIQQQIQHATVDHRMVKFTQARLFLADVAIANEKKTEAIQILNDTVITARQNGARLLTECYTKLSNLYRERGDLQNAEKASKEAIALAGESKDMYLVPELLLTLARLRIAQHDDDGADVILNRATDIVEGMLANTVEPRTRQGLLTTMSDVYTQHFALAAKHNNLAQAYSIIEQIRGRMISEVLVNQPLLRDLDALTPAAQDKITSLKLQLVRSSDEKKRRELIEELFYTEQERWTKRNTRGLLRKPQTSLSQTRRSLQKSEVLLEYVLDEQQSYCLLLSQSEARLIRLPERHSIEEYVGFLNTGITLQRRTSTYQEHLYQLLIAPLGDLERYSQVVIVPDGRLHLLPFDVLYDSKHNYFGTAHTISYAPSAGTEYILRSRETPPTDRTFLGIAGVPYGELRASAAENTKLSTPRGGEGDDYDLSLLRDLPDSAAEVTDAAQLLGDHNPKFIMGQSATKTKLGEVNVSNYEVIHFAVHATVSQNSPGNSALLLRSDPPRADGFLDAREISAMRLRSQLVVLSACNTAVGPLEGEEGIANLSRAFLIAGSTSVVSTLWEVDDTFSLSLMKTFYRHLALGEPEARALQNAKADLLTKFGSDTPPYYWASFILTGDGSARLKLSQTANETGKAYLGE